MSRIATYPVGSMPLPTLVTTCYVGGFSPEYIHNWQGSGPLFGPDGNLQNPIVFPSSVSFDDIIFILTRFVPGFADSYRYVFSLLFCLEAKLFEIRIELTYDRGYLLLFTCLLIWWHQCSKIMASYSKTRIEKPCRTTRG